MSEIVNAKFARNNELDGCKFFLVCLVTLGHAIEPSRYDVGISGYMYSCIYLFHMPLFVILSGYFTNNQNTSLTKFRRQSLGLLETYCLITIFIIAFITKDITDFISPKLSSWYLLSLVFWRGGVLLFRAIDNRILLLVSIVVGLLTFILPVGGGRDYLALYRTCQYFPFFCFGYSLRSIGFKFLKSKIFRQPLAILSVLLITLICCFDDRTLHLISFRRTNIFEIAREVNYSYAYLCVTKLFVGFSSVTISLFLLSISNVFTKLGLYGRNTMTIFVLQALLVHFFTYRIPSTLLAEVILSTLVVFLGCWISNKGYGHLLSNPITSFIKLKNVA